MPPSALALCRLGGLLCMDGSVTLRLTYLWPFVDAESGPTPLGCPHPNP